MHFGSGVVCVNNASESNYPNYESGGGGTIGSLNVSW